MKKALLVTKTGKNYGAVLQAAALFGAMSECGASVQVLQWPYKALTESYSVFKKRLGLHEIFYNLCAIPHAKELKRSAKRFIDFRNEHLVFTKPYEDDQVYEENFDVDTMVVGSDQVWNPHIRYSPVYFLDFGKETARRISYAASIGLKDIPDQYVADFQRYLKRFSNISVREKTAKTALKNIGIDSKVVLDPTLLYDRNYWSDVAVERLCEDEYIFVYTLYKSPLLEELTKRVRQELGCKVVVLHPEARDKFFGDVDVYDAGPKEFLSYIKHAKIVITTSFHGTLFSMNFGVPFITVSPGQTASRLSDILGQYGLDNRMIHSADDFCEDLYSLNEDYREKLSADVAESRRYLAELLAD